ncbi:MAG: hypothetical protein PHD31_01050 [Candidatus Pacebacteria bacterium]|nr:hypothetical protein [Candidatus Paceibacterota bacterium]
MIIVTTEDLIKDINNAKTFEDCMYFFPNQTKEIQLYVLSCAEKLATESIHYLTIVQKHPDTITKEIILMDAIATAKETKDYTNIFEYITKSFFYSNKAIVIIEYLIEKAILPSKSFDNIGSVYKVIAEENILFPSETRKHFKIITINYATKSIVAFAHKNSLAKLLKNDLPMSAIKLMECTLILEDLKKITQELPENHPAKSIIEEICQNNK